MSHSYCLCISGEAARSLLSLAGISVLDSSASPSFLQFQTPPNSAAIPSKILDILARLMPFFLTIFPRDQPLFTRLRLCQSYDLDAAVPFSCFRSPSFMLQYIVSSFAISHCLFYLLRVS